MTLYIKLDQCQSMQSKGYLFIEGSKAGLLTSKQIKDGSNKPSEPFRIMCANTDNLTIKFCKNKEQFLKGQCIGQAYFHAPIIVKKYKHQLNLDNQFILDLELISPVTHQVVGVLVFDLTYDEVSYFQGELGTPADKNMVAPKTNASQKRRDLYKGKCPTKNLFSLIDESAEGQQIKFIQSIYKD